MADNVINLKAVKAGGHTKMDIIITKLDSLREDHRRHASAMDALSSQLSRTHTEIRRVKGDTRGILPSTETLMNI